MKDLKSNDWIETGSGLKFDLLDPTEEMILIEDIANALSKQCRYNGHTNRFYSVAEHCVILVIWAAMNGYSLQDLRDLLLHDAGEAYTGDCPTPLKKILPRFKEIENHIEQVVAKRFGLRLPLLPHLKLLDGRIIVDEKAVLLSDSGNVWAADALDALGVEIKCLSPQAAKHLFLSKYYELFDE